MVEIDAIGDPDGIAKGATRLQRILKLLIAEYAAKIITHSPYYKEGFSFQTGTGGSSLAVTRFMREQMLKDGIKAKFRFRRNYECNGGTFGRRLSRKIIDVKTLIIHQLFLWKMPIIMKLMPICMPHRLAKGRLLIN